MTEHEIEHWLTFRSSEVRRTFASRADFTPTPAQVERGLTDGDWLVRRTFAERSDIALNPEQIGRGLNDEDFSVRLVFKARQAEWRAKWEAAELRKRHASITATKPTLEAL